MFYTVVKNGSGTVVACASYTYDPTALGAPSVLGAHLPSGYTETLCDLTTYQNAKISLFR